MSGERARLFVALELPDQVRDTLVGWRERSAGNVRGLRLVAPESLHLTLCFLGSRLESELEQIAAACDKAISGSRPALTVGRPSWLPRRRPGVLAVEIDDVGGQLGAIQRSLSAALQSGGWYTPERRPFRPHVTVGRVRRGARVDAKEITPPPRLDFEGTTVTLYRSRPMAGGSRYESLTRVNLGSD